MALREDLLDIEHRLWTGGPEAYHRNLDDDCLVAFTSGAGVSSRGDVAGSVGDGPRWRDVSIDVAGLIQPIDGVALLTYRASAKRGEDEQYSALVSSGYVKRDGGWRLMFHQQTPLAEDA